MSWAMRSRSVALLVENDRDLRSLAAALIEETDFKVVEAESAEEALFYLRQHASEVALMMTAIVLACPMDGVELARRVNDFDAGKRLSELRPTSQNPGGLLTCSSPWIRRF